MAHPGQRLLPDTAGRLACGAGAENNSGIERTSLQASLQDRRAVAHDLHRKRIGSGEPAAQQGSALRRGDGGQPYPQLFAAKVRQQHLVVQGKYAPGVPDDGFAFVGQDDTDTVPLKELLAHERFDPL